MVKEQLDHDALAPASVKESMAYLATLPRPLTRGFWVGLFLLHGAILAMVTGQSTLFGHSIDILNGDEFSIIGGGERGFIIAIAIACACILGEACSRSISDVIIGRKLRTVAMDLREACLDAVLRAPVPEVMKLGTGNVITRMTKDIDDVVNRLTLIGSRVISAIVIFPVVFFSLLAIDYRFALVMLATLLCILPFLRDTLSHLPAATNKLSVVEARRNAILLDTLRGLPTLRAYELGPWALKRMEKSSWATIDANASRLPWLLRLTGIAQITYGCWLVATLGLGYWLVSSGSMAAGSASAAVFLIFRAENQVFNAIFFIGDLQNSAVSLGRAVSLAKLRGEQELPIPKDLDRPATVEVTDLSFHYPEGAPVLSGLSVTLEAGTTTALVGTSGAGKSTLAALIAGLQEPSGGRIKVGGIDTSEVSDVWTAKNVTLLSQEVHIFAGTLRQDLQLARPAASDEELYAALEEVGLGRASISFERFFPHGLDTMVGAGAEALPPEVEQQIALARVVLCEPQVLIMDEATAEAGSDNTAVLEKAATRVARSRTALVVAHRLDQAITADRVLVMEAGEIIEDGSHEELLAAGGRYAQLFGVWSGNGHIDEVEMGL